MFFISWCRQNRALPLAMIGLLAGGGLLFAQATTGTLYGKVADESGLPVPGANITISSPQLIGGPETRVSSETGIYRFPRLAPGTYAVKVEMPGFQTVTHEDVLLRAGVSIAVDVVLKVSQIEETVTVTGESPLVDVKSTQTMRTLETDLIENIPLGRVYSDLITSMAGVQNAEYGFTPAQTVHGSTPRDNLYNIDGASTNDTTVGYISTEIPIDMIEEVQVSTGGINAEYGLATGGVFNFVTKSGGNNFSGSGYYYYQGSGTEWNNLTDELRAQIPAGTSTVKDQDFGGSLGGPIVQDKVWFFGHIRRPTVAQLEPFLPNQDRATNQTHWFVKGTSQVSSKTRLNASLTKADFDQYPGNVRSFANADFPETWEKFFRQHTIVHAEGTHLIGDNTILEAKVNRTFKHFFLEFPNNPDFRVGYTDVGNGLQFGGLIGSNAQQDTAKRDMGQFHLTLASFRENWLGGNHELKGGFYMERSPFEQTSFFPNGEDVVQQLRFGVPFRVQLQVYPTETKASIARYAGFLQDQWTLGDRLTLNLGVRFENTEGYLPAIQRGGGTFFAVETQPEIRDIINITTAAPRLGFSLALGDEKRSTVKASYGRYYSQILNQYLTPLIRIGGSETWTWVDRNNDRVFQAGEQGVLVSPRASNLRQSDPDLKGQYTDSIHVGFEHQFTQDFVLQVSGIFKYERDIIEDIDIGRPFSAYRPVTVTNPIDGQPLTIFTLDPSFRTVPSVRFLTNPKDPVKLFRDYKGLEVVAQKRMRNRWQFLAALNISDSYGNLGNSYGYSSGINSIYNDPNTLINVEGPLDMDVPFSLKLQGTYVLPHDIYLSGYYIGTSGFPLKLPEDFPADPALGIYTLRFFREQVPEIVVESFVDVAGVPRGTFRHDFRNLVNARVEKKIALGRGKKLGLIADIFNVFNSSRVTTVQSLRFDLPQFLRPARIENPRIFRFGIRFEF
jgi:outer membrane receptor protein involved in Fe transport